jgi:DnaJ family protein C protein 28
VQIGCPFCAWLTHRRSELEHALNAFRSTLRSSWTRQALRNLTLDTPPSLLPKVLSQFQIAPHKVAALRDTAWIAREGGYHAKAIEEVNALVRKYNGMAPAAVRRGYYSVDAELERVYQSSAEDVLNGLKERAEGVGKDANEASAFGSDPEVSEVRSWDPGMESVSEMWKGWWQRLLRR